MSQNIPILNSSGDIAKNYKAELSILGYGEIFGDEDEVDGERTITSVCSTDKGELLVIPIKEFFERLRG